MEPIMTVVKVTHAFVEGKYNCKRLITQFLDLVEILYSDAVTKAVLSVWELLLDSKTKTKGG